MNATHYPFGAGEKIQRGLKVLAKIFRGMSHRNFDPAFPFRARWGFS
jgi:hypothetical protein